MDPGTIEKLTTAILKRVL